MHRRGSFEAINYKTSVVTFSLGAGMAGDVIMSLLLILREEPRRKPPKHAHAFGIGAQTQITKKELMLSAI